MEDVCFSCEKEIEVDSTVKILFGPKTALEWYICKECQNSRAYDQKKIMERVIEQDSRFYLENQEEVKKE